MTPTDFREQFDLYYNNISSNQAPGLNDYEKSVFLTDAQEECVLGLYNGRGPLGGDKKVPFTAYPGCKPESLYSS